ncbi:MAG: hypothetical protein ACI8SI_002742 [Congregibacter sp.]|jgi:hypothetical protein
MCGPERSRGVLDNSALVDIARVKGLCDRVELQIHGGGHTVAQRELVSYGGNAAPVLIYKTRTHYIAHGINTAVTLDRL